MSTTETRVIIERAIAFGMENYEAIGDEFHSEDVVNHGPVEDDYGREAWKQRQAQFIDAFTDREWTVDALFADGDMACVRYTFSGTHTGDLTSATNESIYGRSVNGALTINSTGTMPDRCSSRK